ncbi:DnaD domain protein [Eupransor demetentiae]|uniref:Replication initiation and membrane attachment protein DnaB (DnaB2) n=1 Tax=Eupransor demetentiae TaxID=3109584 RepID=A0ABP0EMP7_9LACO|nr:Replication initiation and membrane attachment protein DnaB (DnaB2) [Lactobacillaceae bacterium LMG 33000]
MRNDESKTELKASAGLLLQSRSLISNSDLERLDDLYLPFLGPNTAALYRLLAKEVTHVDEWQERPDHNFILDSLTMSLPEFVRSRRRLEGAGLLKSYYLQDQLGELYTYQLLAPLSAEDFFKEPLLAGLLYNYLGEERFLQLEKRYGLQGQREIKGEDLSANFLQVYGRQGNRRAPASQIPTSTKPSFDRQASDFDFKGMTALVQGTQEDEVARHRDFILAQQILYGFNEQEMARAVSQATSLADHKIDEGQLQRILASQGQSVKPKEKGPSTTVAAKESSKQPVSTALEALLQAANEMAPMDFLQALKQDNHGFVANNERRILTDLIEKTTLPAPVINILTYQVLVGMDNTSLKRNLVEAIANDWSKAQIKTAEGAIKAIKDRQNRPQSKTNNYRGKPRATRVEPKLVKNEDAHPQSHNQADMQAALAALQQLRTKK